VLRRPYRLGRGKSYVNTFDGLDVLGLCGRLGPIILGAVMPAPRWAIGGGVTRVSGCVSVRVKPGPSGFVVELW